MVNSTVIAAVSTPPGKGGVAIIRMSGEGSFEIAERVFFPKGKKQIKDYPVRTQIFGNIIFRGEEIDDGLITLFKSPASYTGEDTVEISCHGGSLVTSTVLEALFSNGARPAEAGEFTRRALLNGKLTLTDAEAVGNLLDARTHAQIMLNTERSRTHLSAKIEDIRKSLVDTLSSMYARIDYPDEDLGEFDNEELLSRLSLVREATERLMSTYKTGRAIAGGIETVICGKPNAGKSSLYNLLLGEDAAIVTDIKGTTRDVLTSELSLGKLMLRLSDTAGVREISDDEIELMGIRKTHDKIRSAELILALFDAESGFEKEDEEIISSLKSSSAVKLAIVNKCDTGRDFPIEKLKGGFDKLLFLSVKIEPYETKRALIEECEALFTDEKIEIGCDAIISNARQNAKLTLAKSYIDTAIGALSDGLTQDLASSDIERALGEIAELDGRAVSDEVLGDIFSKFCVGK